MRNSIHMSKIDQMQVSDTDNFVCDVDGTANGAGLYTCMFICYGHPDTGNTKQSIIQRMITETATGDQSITWAVDANGYQNHFTNDWSNRTSLTFAKLVYDKIHA